MAEYTIKKQLKLTPAEHETLIEHCKSLHESASSYIRRAVFKQIEEDKKEAEYITELRAKAEKKKAQQKRK